MIWPFTHRHTWTGSAWNQYGVEVEQRCKCGARRHHLAVDFRGLFEDPVWRDGRHPNARRYFPR